MNREQSCNRFQLKHQPTLNNDVKSVTAIELYCFICDWQWNLSFEPELPEREFMTQALFVRRFKQAGTERAMNFNACTNHSVRQFIEPPRLRVSAVNI